MSDEFIKDRVSVIDVASAELPDLFWATQIFTTGTDDLHGIPGLTAIRKRDIRDWSATKRRGSWDRVVPPAAARQFCPIWTTAENFI